MVDKVVANALRSRAAKLVSHRSGALHCNQQPDQGIRAEWIAMSMWMDSGATGALLGACFESMTCMEPPSRIRLSS